MTDTIQIGIPCGRNSEYFVEFLISSIERTVSGKYNIEFIFGINQTGVDQAFLEGIPTKCKKSFAVFDTLDPGPGTSTAHGKIMDYIFEKMDSKYGMMIDCDTSFLYKNWDEKLISFLDGETIIIGTEYGKDQQKFMGNPNCIMCLFMVKELKDTGLSWEPRNCYVDINEENSQVYGRAPGDKILLDTSCDIPVCLHNSGRLGQALPLVSPRIDKTKIKFMTEGMRGEEYQLYGTPIVTHLGRGLSRDFNNNADAIRWRTRVDEWLKSI